MVFQTATMQQPQLMRAAINLTNPQTQSTFDTASQPSVQCRKPSPPPLPAIKTNEATLLSHNSQSAINGLTGLEFKLTEIHEDLRDLDFSPKASPISTPTSAGASYFDELTESIKPSPILKAHPISKDIDLDLIHFEALPHQLKQGSAPLTKTAADLLELESLVPKPAILHGADDFPSLVEFDDAPPTTHPAESQAVQTHPNAVANTSQYSQARAQQTDVKQTRKSDETANSHEPEERAHATIEQVNNYIRHK